MTESSKILLVDDDDGIRASLSAFLSRSGFQVDTVSNGEQALEKLEKFKPDLIVMDVLMPRMDGRETLRRMRQAGNLTPVILLTQVGEATERAMALEEGADDYLGASPCGVAAVARGNTTHRHRMDIGQRRTATR